MVIDEEFDGTQAALRWHSGDTRAALRRHLGGTVAALVYDQYDINNFIFIIVLYQIQKL